MKQMGLIKALELHRQETQRLIDENKKVERITTQISNENGEVLSKSNTATMMNPCLNHSAIFKRR
jgi:hypothetical protein